MGTSRPREGRNEVHLEIGGEDLTPCKIFIFSKEKTTSHGIDCLSRRELPSTWYPLIMPLKRWLISHGYRSRQSNPYIKVCAPFLGKGYYHRLTSALIGAYIVNPLTEAGRDVKENAGFLLYFYPTAAETRLTTYSVLNHIPTTPTGVDDPPLLDEGRQYPDENLGSVLDSNTVSQYADSDAVEFFAFKALPRDFHTVDRSQRDEEEQSHAETCKEAVDRVVDRIKEEMVRSTKPEASRMAELVQEKDVIG